MSRVLWIIFGACGLIGCSGKFPTVTFHETILKSISIIDRNGMAETITNMDRLKQYENVDFCKPKPYQKVLRICHRDADGNMRAYIHSYHENGQPSQYLEVVNSRAFGKYREWYSTGKPKLEVQVVGGEPDLGEKAERTWLFDGCAVAWDENGFHMADISYEKGMLHGESQYYHANGTVWKKVLYKKNLLDGISRVYLDDGTLFQIAEYESGKLHGESIRYWSADQIASREQFNNNELVLGEYFDRMGKLISRVNQGEGFRVIFGKNDVAEVYEYHNGIPEGEVKVFGVDKKVLRKYHVKNHIKHGEEVEYYEVPHARECPKISVMWSEGKLQGIAKTWYENGVQESSREISGNQKNGISMAWYRDGSLMLIEEYQNDKLVKGEYFRKGEESPTSIIKEGRGIATLFDAEGNFVHRVTYESGCPSGTS